MSPGEPPRICARSAASSPAASTCDDFEAWASSTNLSGMEEIGLRAPAFGASGFGGLALGLQQSAFIQNNCQSLVIQTTRFFRGEEISVFSAAGRQPFP